MLETTINNGEANNQDTAAPDSRVIDPALLEEMVQTGVLYGRRKNKTHPRMKPYIFAIRNGIEIFDLGEVLSLLEKAQEFLKETAKKSKTILLVGTQPASKVLIKELGEKLNLPYVNERWLGGTLTNYQTISKRIKYFTNLRADKESGKLEKYTKKERLEFEKSIHRFTTLFSGLEKLSSVPDAVLLIDANDHKTALREAKRLRIPVAALVNSDFNPEEVDYPIPVNTRAKSSIQWVLGKLEQSIQEGLKEKFLVVEAAVAAAGGTPLKAAPKQNG